jgi:RAB protein geranylgeranyltransferase component A
MPPLHSLAPAVQHALLVRELLLALSGVEGRYVRVAASSSSNVSGANNPGHMLRDLNLVVEADAADRSAASQVALLLPICESAVQLKEFVRVHSRYDTVYVTKSIQSKNRQEAVWDTC